jgi:hypothetical protein
MLQARGLQWAACDLTRSRAECRKCTVWTSVMGTLTDRILTKAGKIIVIIICRVIPTFVLKDPHCIHRLLQYGLQLGVKKWTFWNF